MDWSILYIFLFVSLAITGIFISKKLREKNMVESDDLMLAMRLLQLSVDIIDQLNLKNEKEICNIADIVIMSISYVDKNIKTDNIDIKRSHAIDYAYYLCDRLNLVLTTERKRIIDDLITISLLTYSKNEQEG